MTTIYDVDPPFHFRVLDTVVDALRVHLAEVPPEQGCALFGHGPLIASALLDSRGGYSPSYWDISAQLGEAVLAIERAKLGRFVGTVHSHPDGVIDPSGGDRQSTTELLQANPHLTSVLVAIITRGAPYEFNHLPIGSTHRMSLQIMTLSSGKLEVVAVPGVIVPVRDVIAALGVSWNPSDATVDDWLADPRNQATRMPRRVATGTVDGFRISAPADAGGADRDVVIPLNYPIAGPIVVERTNGERRLTPLPWNPAIDPREQARRIGGRHPFPDPPAQQENPSPMPTRTDRVTPLIGDLSNDHVLVAGAGSVGSRLAEDLVRAGVGEISLVDPDTVSLPNLARSTYRSSDLDRPKVDALARALLDINPGLTVHTYARSLGELTELANILPTVDLVIGATDDMPQQYSLAAEAYRRGIPTVCTAMYEFARCGEIVISMPKAKTACVSCAMGNSTLGSGHKPEPDYGLHGRLSSHPGLGAAINLVSSVGSLAALGILAGPSSAAAQAVLVAAANGQTLGMVSTVPEWEFFPRVIGTESHQIAPQSVWLRVERSPTCPVCAGHPDGDVAERADESVPLGPIQIV